MASPRCQKTRPHHTRTPCQEVPEGPEPWTWSVSNVAFWFEENKVQKWHPQDAKKRAPTTPEHPARRCPKAPEPWTWPVPNVAFWFENKVQNCIPKMPKKRARTTPEHPARRCPKAPNHGHGRCLTLLSDSKKTRSRNGIPKMSKNAPPPHQNTLPGGARRPRTMDMAGA